MTSFRTSRSMSRELTNSSTWTGCKWSRVAASSSRGRQTSKDVLCTMSFSIVPRCRCRGISRRRTALPSPNRYSGISPKMESSRSGSQTLWRVSSLSNWSDQLRVLVKSSSTSLARTKSSTLTNSTRCFRRSQPWTEWPSW